MPSSRTRRGRRQGINRSGYVYDLDDNWEHVIEIESVAVDDPAMKYLRFVHGARRDPARGSRQRSLPTYH